MAGRFGGGNIPRPSTANVFMKKQARDKNHELFYKAVAMQRKNRDQDLVSLHKSIDTRMEDAKKKRFDMFKDIQIRLKNDLVMKE